MEDRRRELIDAILVYRGLADQYVNDGIAEYEDIMDRHGASYDDSDPDEGFFVTMSEDDLFDALSELVSVVWNYGIIPLVQDLANPVDDAKLSVSDIIAKLSTYQLPQHRYDKLVQIEAALKKAADMMYMDD